MRSSSVDADRGCWLRFSLFRRSLFIVCCQSTRVHLISSASCARVCSLWCGIKLLLLFIYLFLCVCVQYSVCSRVWVCEKCLKMQQTQWNKDRQEDRNNNSGSRSEQDSGCHRRLFLCIAKVCVSVCVCVHTSISFLHMTLIFTF